MKIPFLILSHSCAGCFCWNDGGFILLGMASRQLWTEICKCAVWCAWISMDIIIIILVKLITKGVFTCENSHPVRVWNWHDIVISCRVYMKGHFMLTDVIVTPYWIGYRRLHMGYPFQTPGRVISCWSKRPYRIYKTLEWVFVPGWKSRPGRVPGVNSHWYDPLWTVWDFVLISCKRIQIYKRESEWTRTGMKVAPVSCKHPLISTSSLIYMYWFIGPISPKGNEWVQPQECY